MACGSVKSSVRNSDINSSLRDKFVPGSCLGMMLFAFDVAVFRRLVGRLDDLGFPRAVDEE